MSLFFTLANKVHSFIHSLGASTWDVSVISVPKCQEIPTVTVPKPLDYAKFRQGSNCCGIRRVSKQRLFIPHPILLDFSSTYGDKGIYRLMDRTSKKTAYLLRFSCNDRNSCEKMDAFQFPQKQNDLRLQKLSLIHI